MFSYRCIPSGCRGPGKRQIKPTAAVLDLVLPAAEDEDDDEDFIGMSRTGALNCVESRLK